MSSETSKISEQQFWNAFQYVSGELSPQECLQFEQQMAGDVRLCEAVAEVTILTCSVADRSTVAAKVLDQSASDQPGSRFIATVVTICCCLMLAVFLKQGTERADSDVELTENVTSDAELIVATWADALAAETEEIVDLEEPMPQELSVPDWMLAALTLPDRDDTEVSGDGLVPDDLELF